MAKKILLLKYYKNHKVNGDSSYRLLFYEKWKIIHMKTPNLSPSPFIKLANNLNRSSSYGGECQCRND